jgi:hypothetical protein
MLRAGRRSRGDAGAVALISALVSIVLLVVAAFVVDIGNTWFRRGELQKQADGAALYAAEWLPAASPAAQKQVARQAAWHLCQHPVHGQEEFTTFPSCTTPSDPGLDSWTDQLIAAGQISFPSPTQIKVTTPPAQVDFEFGEAAGASGTVQQKSAVAKIGSPGDIEPIGLSMNCMLSVANNMPGLDQTLAGVLPLNYMSTGPIRPEQIQTDWPSSPAEDSGITVAYQATSPTSTYKGIAATISLQGSGWGTLLDKQVQVWFAQGKQDARKLFSTPIATLSVLGRTTVAVPPEVVSTVGVWQVKVAVRNPPVPITNPDPAWKISRGSVEFTVNVPPSVSDLLGCGRALKSPRACDALISRPSCTSNGTPENLKMNLQEGIDHGLMAQTALLSPSVPATVPDMLAAVNDPTVLFKCDSAGGEIKDIGGNITNGLTPNCVHLEQGATDVREFTDGFLGKPESTATGVVAGRLVCTDARPCSESKRLAISSDSLGLEAGYKVNDDRFTDFVQSSSILDAAMFFNLTTYLTPGIPAVTPDSKILPEIYSSHRFFWVPIMASPAQSASPGNTAGDYPILTFRPVFVTQNQPSGITSVDFVLDLVDSWVKSLLGIDASDDHGILMDPTSHELRALRFMTIEPTALPAVPDDYTGPTSEYVGTGPKIIRLVK